MKINTKYFGEIEVPKEEIIIFEKGIPGFDKYTKYILFNQGEEYFPFLWMQSIEEPQIAFIVTDPKISVPDYYIDVDDGEIKDLDIKDSKDVSVYTIVVVSEDSSKITTNLRAPIIINRNNNRGKQVIINNDYNIRHIIYEHNEKSGG